MTSPVMTSSSMGVTAARNASLDRQWGSLPTISKFSFFFFFRLFFFVFFDFLFTEVSVDGLPSITQARAAQKRAFSTSFPSPRAHKASLRRSSISLIRSGSFVSPVYPITDIRSVYSRRNYPSGLPAAKLWDRSDSFLSPGKN